ncbi:MAG: single-stranded DNA-binding protein, partial [Dehalococcoidales bacterium]|nr:single-stranded DNA-binding protein [Dehalococcoidales bacterium]
IAREMQLSLDIVNNPEAANIFITSKAYYRSRPQKIIDAEAANIPIYVLKSNTPNQIRQLLNTVYPSVDHTDPITAALEEAQSAVNQVKNGEDVVELRPQSAYIRRLQHLIAEQNDLPSDSTGKDPNRRVRIFRPGAK